MRRLHRVKHQRLSPSVQEALQLDLKTKLPLVKRGGISSENSHSLSRFLIVLCIALKTHLIQQDIGTCLDRVTAPQPLGPSRRRLFQSIINLLQFIAKQVLCRPDSYSKQEPNVRTLCPDKKMMVSSMKLTAPKQLSLSANPNHLKTGRSESSLRLCGESWLTSSKFSSLIEMTKVHLSSQRSTPAHKFSALSIEETVFENLCSNSPLWKLTVVYSCCT